MNMTYVHTFVTLRGSHEELCRGTLAKRLKIKPHLPLASLISGRPVSASCQNNLHALDRHTATTPDLPSAYRGRRTWELRQPLDQRNLVVMKMDLAQPPSVGKLFERVKMERPLTEVFK